MKVRSVAWALRNNAQWSLAKYLNRLCKLFLRNCPDEFIIQTIQYSMKDGTVQRVQVNRRLNHDRRNEMKRFLKANNDNVAFFEIDFISFQYRENIQLKLSGSAPFDHFDLVGENIPNWLHEIVNRRFQSDIGFMHKMWSYFYNHRLFRHSLGR